MAKSAPGAERHLAVLGIAASAVAVVAVYWPTFRDMAQIWLRSETFAHGLIVAPLVGYLVYHKRHALGRVPVQPFWPGLALVLSASLIWLIARYLSVNALEQFAAVALIPATIVTVAGVRTVRVVAFALIFLFFAVPFGEFLIPWLMEVTADFTTVLLRLTGFPVYRDGMFIAVPGGDFEIATACSGIRYLIASVVLGTIFAYLTYRTWRKKLIFIGLSFVVPIVANGIRAYIIVVLASLSGMKLAVGVDHFIYGWVFFGIVMFVLFLIGVRYRDDDVDPQASAPERDSTPPATTRRVDLRVIVAALAALALGPVLLAVMLARAGTGESVRLAPPPAGWQPVDAESPWQPAFQPSDQSLRRAVSNGVATIFEFVDVYNTADGGTDAASSGNRLTDNKVWRIDETVAVDESLRIVRLRSGSQTMFVATWYQTGSRRNASPFRAKLTEAWDTVIHGGTISAIVAFSIDGADDKLEVLREFVSAYGDALSRCLQQPDAAACRD